MIRMILMFVVVFFVATFPATWLLMLFLGNVGTNVSYWGAPARSASWCRLCSAASAPSASPSSSLNAAGRRRS